MVELMGERESRQGAKASVRGEYVELLGLGLIQAQSLTAKELEIELLERCVRG